MNRRVQREVCREKRCGLYYVAFTLEYTASTNSFMAYHARPLTISQAKYN